MVFKGSLLWWHSDTAIESNSFSIHHWIINHCQNHISKMFWITKSFKVFSQSRDRIRATGVAAQTGSKTGSRKKLSLVGMELV